MVQKSSSLISFHTHLNSISTARVCVVCGRVTKRGTKGGWGADSWMGIVVIVCRANREATLEKNKSPIDIDDDDDDITMKKEEEEEKSALRGGR